MSAPLPAPVVIATDERDQFVVSHGKSGVIGVFTLTSAVTLARGQKVIVKTNRGIEIGEVLGPASVQQARLFGATSAGILLRPYSSEDESRRLELAQLEQQIFDDARTRVARDVVEIDILDVDLFFDGIQAIVQFVGKDTDTEKLADAIERDFRLTIRLENLAVAPAPDEHDHEHRCDKPDCGKEGGGGCTSCSTGGGCSSCGSGKVDIKEYFGHLRTKMESRVPLV